MEDVDLAHPGHPLQVGGTAAVHLGAEGNETPLRVTGLRSTLNMPPEPPVSIYEVLAARAQTIRHIPISLHGEWSQLQASCINAFCDSPNTTTLWAMLALPKLTLRPPKVRGKHAAAHTIDLLRARLTSFQNGDWAGLWDTLQKEADAQGGVQTRSAKKSRTETSSPDAGAVRRAKQSLADGCPGKALQQLSSQGIHDVHDPHIWDSLQKLHPKGTPVDTDSLPPRVPLDLGDDDIHSFWDPLIQQAILSFPRGTAPGPSGLRASHLQDAIRRPGRGTRLVAALSRLAHKWAHGNIPEEFSPPLWRANLMPL